MKNEIQEEENGSSWYKWYVLWLVTTGFVIAELGHYQLGTTTKLMAQELHYGDQSCMMTADLRVSQLPVVCEKVDSKEICESLTLNGSRYCEWGYSGLGLDYQILAGPTFMATNTVAGILMGLAGDRYNRARILSACTLIFSLTTVATGAVTAYWHFLVLRMTMAAFQSGCIPLSTSILTDLFPQNQRALALSIFHFGIYVGYGIAFPVGRFTPYLDPDGLSWRLCYYIQGVIGIVIAIFTFITLRDPEKTAVGEEVEREKKTGKKTNLSIWRLMLQPKMIVFCMAASLRYAGGASYAYNTDLFYREYYPDVYLGWWLFIIYVGVGSLGVMAGGLVSDRIVGKNGVRSRALVLAVSQLLATPPAYGSLLCGPTWAMITFAISYFFAEWWFGILYAVLVEIIPVSLRSTALGIFVFVMMNIGGNLPVLVDPLTKAIGYMEALLVMYPSLYLVCTILFFISVPMMKAPVEEDEDDLDLKEQPV